MDINHLISRLKFNTDIILNGHILNPFWNNHNTRRKKRYAVTSEAAINYLKQYASFVAKLSPESYPASDEPDRIFTIWYNGEENAPEIVKACFRSMRRHMKQEIIVLNEKTLFEWISLPDEIIKKWKSGKICNANFSDICRLELLYRYGGIWMDATDYVTGPIPKYIIESDFFLFKTGDKYGKWYSFIESCFIRARKGNQLLAIWHDAVMEYWKNENSAIDYFVNLILFRFVVETNSMAAELYARMPIVDHSQILDFWRYYGNKQFNELEYKLLMGNSFMKKTSYHTKSAENPIPGSFAEFIINS